MNFPIVVERPKWQRWIIVPIRVVHACMINGWSWEYFKECCYIQWKFRDKKLMWKL